MVTGTDSPDVVLGGPPPLFPTGSTGCHSRRESGHSGRVVRHTAHSVGDNPIPAREADLHPPALDAASGDVTRVATCVDTLDAASSPQEAGRGTRERELPVRLAI